MIAGLPGTGIGGIFYLMSAFLMPVREMGRVVRGRSSLRRWRLIVEQMSLAGGVIAGFWMTGWLLALLLPVRYQGPAGSHVHNVIRTKPIMISMTVLFGVVFAVELLSLATRKRVVR